MNPFYEKKNFNIDSTVINDNYRVSTAAIFYDEIFGERFQLETWFFVKGHKGSKIKIHEVPCNEYGLRYCKEFHKNTVAMVKSKLNNHDKN